MVFHVGSLKLIFFICPFPKGSKENQFAPFRDWGKQIDFQRIGEPFFMR